MGKKHAHISAPAYWVPSSSPAPKSRGVSKKAATKAASKAGAQRKLDPQQRARQAAAAKKAGKKGKKGKR